MSLYYLDTSALLPVYLRRAVGHMWVKNLGASSQGNILILAEVTEAELAAALQQLVRGNVLRKKLCDDALRVFWQTVDTGGYRIIPALSPIVRRAAALCEHHSLKGYDAIQLACALAARDAARKADVENVAHGLLPLGDPIFLTEDHRLSNAAIAEGFAVDSPLLHP